MTLSNMNTPLVKGYFDFNVLDSTLTVNLDELLTLFVTVFLISLELVFLDDK